MTPEQLETFTKDGVLHLSGFFSPEERNQLLRESLTIMEDASLMSPRDEQFYARYGSDNATFVDCHGRGELLRSLAEGPRLSRLAEQLFPHGSVFHMSLLQLSQAGRAQGIAWHQDVDPQTSTGTLCNFLIYPEDLDVDSGPLTYVPGSHTRGLLPPGDHYAPMEGQQTLLARGGDLVIVSATLFHCVPRNRTQRRRFSLNFRFRDARLPRQALSVGVYRNGKFDYSRGMPVPAEHAPAA